MELLERLKRRFSAMSKQLYVVYFESANYAGYGEHARVWATSEEEAKEAVSDYAEEYYYDQDGDQLEEDDIEDGPYANVMSAVLQAGSEFEEFIADPQQAEHFYPIINTND